MQCSGLRPLNFKSRIANMKTSSPWGWKEPEPPLRVRYRCFKGAVMNIGDRFSALIVESTESTDYGITLYQCSCDCGGAIKVTERYLKSKAVHSCGCLFRQRKIRKINKKTISDDVDKKLMALRSWIKGRCLIESQSKYKYYGGNGVTICREWMTNFTLFKKFCLDNGWEPGLEIDRIDTRKGYSPDNCRFVSHEVNLSNRINSLRFVINGTEYETSKKASADTGIPAWRIVYNCNRGYDGFSMRKLYPETGVLK